MIRLSSLSLLATLALCGATPVLSADAVSSLPRTALDLEALEGQVDKIEDGSFDILVGEIRHTVRTNERTKYRLNDEDSTRDKVLVKDQQVSVQLEQGLATTVEAKSAVQPKTVKGKIKTVGEGSFVVLVDGKERTIEIDSDTTYSLDGKEVRKEQVLVADQEVSVEVTDGVASKVSARSKA